MFRAAASLALLVTLAAPVRAACLRADSPAFVGYSRTTDRDLRIQLTKLQQFDALVRRLTGLDPQGISPLAVYFVQGRDFPGLGVAGAEVVGFYASSPGTTGAFIATDRARSNFGGGVSLTIFHEYTHYFMFHATRAAYPAWYVEGFAEYLSTAQFGPGWAEFGGFDKGRVFGLLLMKWLPMQQVMTARVGDFKTVEQVAQFYAQSWLTVHYLSREPARRQQLNRYLAALNRGEPAATAFGECFGVGFEAFGERLRAYLKGHDFSRSRISGVAAASDPVTAVTALPKSANDLLLPAVRLAMLSAPPAKPKPETTAARARLLQTIRRATPATGDAFADATRAEAEIKLGDRADGLARLGALLARDPGDAQALYLRGVAMLDDAGDPTARLAARKLLARANAARPDDYRILFAHARSFDSLDLPDREVEVLLRANALAPDVGEIAATAALVLARRGDKAQAVALLTPIANNPHGGSASVGAAQLVEAIGRGEKPSRFELGADDE